MKTHAIRFLFIATLSLGLAAGATAQTATEVFPSDGTFLVPAGVTTITVKAWGGGGGDNQAGAPVGGAGGAGGSTGGVW